MARINKFPSKQHLVEKLNITFRYLDSILALNKDDFNIYSQEIFPVEISLNIANIDDKECAFLDLCIHINNGKLNTRILI